MSLGKRASLLRHLQRDHRPQGNRPRQAAEHVHRWPFKLKSYTQNVGAQFVANRDYWGLIGEGGCRVMVGTRAVRLVRSAGEGPAA